MTEPDYYAILSVSPKSSPQELRRQYRRLAKIYHPDRNPGEEEWCAEQLKKVNDAFATLSDPKRKAQYDRDLATDRSERGPQVQGGPEYGSAGDGRSVYTPWRPDGPSGQPSPPPSPVQQRPRVSVLKPETNTGRDALLIGLVVVVLGAVSVLVFRSILPTPVTVPPQPTYQSSLHVNSPPLPHLTPQRPRREYRRIATTHTTHAQHHRLTPEEKDARAAALAAKYNDLHR